MDYGFSEEQKILRKTARDFLSKECPKAMVRQMAEDEKGYSPSLWKKMTEMGWLGLVLPSEYGGSGGSFLDLVMLLEEMGRVLLPSPFSTTIVMCGLYILEAGNEQQKKDILHKIVKGEAILTLALSEPDVEYDPDSITVKAVANSDGYLINGNKLFVPYAHIANYLLCVTRTGENIDKGKGLTTFIVDNSSSGLNYTPLKTLARDKQYEVTFKDVLIPEHNILGDFDNGWRDVERTLQRATVALCAEMNGGAQNVLDMTVEYAKQRVQFDRPIGSMQALQHHCANIAVSIEASRSATYEAAWRIGEGLPCSIEVSMAKSLASECYTQTTQLSMLIHGGVGYMEDHDLPLYYRQAKTAEVTLGDADYHREKIAQELLD